MCTMRYYPVYKRYESSFWLHLPVFSLFEECVSPLWIPSTSSDIFAPSDGCFFFFYSTNERFIIGIYRTVVSLSPSSAYKFLELDIFNRWLYTTVITGTFFSHALNSRSRSNRKSNEWIVSTTVTLVTAITIIARSPTSTTFSMHNDSQFNLNRGQTRQDS